MPRAAWTCRRACSGCEAGAEVNALERLVANLARLPGLGRKSASRIAYHLLRADESFTRSLAEDLATLHQTIRNCSVMGSITGHLAPSRQGFQAPYLGDFVGESRRWLSGHHGV